jgi:hypothetical protein
MTGEPARSMLVDQPAGRQFSQRPLGGDQRGTGEADGGRNAQVRTGPGCRPSSRNMTTDELGRRGGQLARHDQIRRNASCCWFRLVRVLVLVVIQRVQTKRLDQQPHRTSTRTSGLSSLKIADRPDAESGLLGQVFLRQAEFIPPPPQQLPEFTVAVRHHAPR